ncbi:MAG: hypothetical protein FJX67_10630 [Alphaproteobacteria bacterium]|nr:hypothetical protein [Alphaproteobacteria bacterium]
MQLLRASSDKTDGTIDYAAITGNGGEMGVPHGGLLMDFADAVLSTDDRRLAAVSERIRRELGDAVLVDSACVAGFFNAIDRVADSTGTPVEDEKAADTADLRRVMGINTFTGAPRA